MTMEEKRSMGIQCDICEEYEASEIKGGVYEDKVDIWFVCKNCVDKITDRRAK